MLVSLQRISTAKKRLIFLFLHGASNEYPQYIFLYRNENNIYLDIYLLCFQHLSRSCFLIGTWSTRKIFFFIKNNFFPSDVKRSPTVELCASQPVFTIIKCFFICPVGPVFYPPSFEMSMIFRKSCIKDCNFNICSSVSHVP